MALKRVDAVVVGAGAGGGIVAKELAEAGLSVVLLERGKWYSPFDCRKDDLRNQRTTPLGNAFGPDDERTFFDLLVAHTMQGFYGDPRHGGNRERVSWKMLGLPYPQLRGRLRYDFTAPSKGEKPWL